MKNTGDHLSEIRAFMKSRIILSAAELDLFTCLDNNPLTAHELAIQKNLDQRAIIRILDCLVAFDLLKKESGKYILTGPAKLFSSRHPQSILPSVMHLNRLWDTWSLLSYKICGPEYQRSSNTGSFSDDERKAFIGAMHVIGRDLAGHIVNAYNAGKFSHLLDIGGGSGAYTIAFLKKYRNLKATIFDLPEVIPITRENIATEKLENKVDFCAGDFTRDKLPAGADLALLSAIIHQNSPAENTELYRKIYEVLPSGGVLLIRDHIMEEDRIHPPSGALFAINMLVNTTGGDTYTFNEIREGLVEAGFKSVSLIRKGDAMDGLVEARK